MPPDARRLTGFSAECVQQLLAGLSLQAGDAKGVAANHQAVGAGFRVPFAQWPERRLALGHSVAGVGAVGIVGVAKLALAVAERVIGAEAVKLRLARTRQCGPRGRHVRPFGLAALGRDHMGREHGALGLDGHVGGIAVPAHVALQHLDDIIALFRADRPIGAHIADRRNGNFQRPEPTGKVPLFFIRQMLSRKDQQAVLQPDAIESGKVCIVELSQTQARHRRAEAGGKRGHCEGSFHRRRSGVRRKP